MARSKIRTVLLTGDDGYYSLGTRLLVHVLKDKYDLQIAATRTQQSGVGGKMSLQSGGVWGEAEVDGVPALWVDGSPVDVVECALTYFKKKKFDLVISGINLGANIGGAIISSGTYAAAYRALHINVCKQAIAISWNLSSEYFFKKHDINEDLKIYQDYPGKTAKKVIDYAINNNFWSCPLLNINLPLKKSNKIKFTKFLFNIRDFYSGFVALDKKTHRYNYPPDGNFYQKREKNEVDAEAVANGYISITPCKLNNLNEDVYLGLKSKTITL